MKKVNKNKKVKNVFFAGAIIFLVSICVFKMNNENHETLDVSVNSNENRKVEWGIKRKNNHEQPDVGENNRRVLENGGGICLGNDTEKNIYLTFDSGYEAGYMGNILDTLKNNNVKATFFITSHYVNTASDFVQRMIDEGHIIGNHTPKSLMPGIEVLKI